ncbi:hypothetical protein [Hyphomicrobium sp. CS1GBMeth3]|uniref:hypothetical protein n=1 Tax=Hyphomicrobium sp. CS1GBMeth3 TaxID=1892845 RepID=UPI000AFB2669|nr:hypothetical protein [Hyphomicrobium sp. CS1GBMeth3]
MESFAIGVKFVFGWDSLRSFVANRKRDFLANSSTTSSSSQIAALEKQITAKETGVIYGERIDFHLGIKNAPEELASGGPLSRGVWWQQRSMR